MGDVFLGRSKRKEPVAVKLLRRDLASDPQFRARFRREVQVALRVRGFCTAKLLGADVDAERPWLATEFVDGPTLLQFVGEHGGLPTSQLHALALGLLEALHAIHSAGVVHRDLTPSNVLLSANGPKVVDFGIAHPLEATGLTMTGAVIGTPAWMAPEQAQGLPPIPATDMFAWGLVVVYAGTAHPPFGVGRAEVVLHRIVYDEPDLGNVEEPLRGQVGRCLSKDPASRPTVDDVVSQLVDRDMPTQLQTVAERTMLADWTIPIGPVVPTPRRRPSREALLTIAAALLVFMVAGIVFAFSSRGRQGDAPTAATAQNRSSIVPTTPRSTAGVPTTAAPTAAPSVRTVDWNNRKYSVACGSTEPADVQLKDGKWTAPTGPLGGSIAQVYGAYGDAAADGTDTALVYVPCTVGASGNVVGGNIFVYSAAGGEVAQLGQTVLGHNPGFSALGFSTTESIFAPGDSLCCPSGTETHQYRLVGGTWQQQPTASPTTQAPGFANPADAVEAWLAGEGHRSAGECGTADPARDIGKWCYFIKDDGETTKVYSAGLTFADGGVFLTVQGQPGGGWVLTNSEAQPTLGSS